MFLSTCVYPQPDQNPSLARPRVVTLWALLLAWMGDGMPSGCGPEPTGISLELPFVSDSRGALCRQAAPRILVYPSSVPW